jgi:hypothetical protein
MRRITIITALFALIPLQLVASSEVFIDTQIGPFNFSRALIEETDIVKIYGKGEEVVKAIDDKTYVSSRIYYDPIHKLWIQFRLSNVLSRKLSRVVEGIVATRIRISTGEPITKKHFDTLETSRGINIGDSIAQVISTIGHSKVAINLSKESKFSVLSTEFNLEEGIVFRYLSNEERTLLFNEYYFDGGVLSTILISMEE